MRQEKTPPKSKTHINEQKDQFITTSLTLRKLQKNKIIPSQISPINLNTQQIHYANPNQGSKYLLISNRNIVYYGELNVNGYPESNIGIFIYSDGSYYQGNVKNGKPQGQGKITNLQNSFCYVGQWRKGLPEGNGRQNIGNNVYEGEFRQGKKNGKGKLLYGDGSYYEGLFHDNIIQGTGRYFNNNNFWQGNWQNGYLQGQGKQIIAKQDIKNLQSLQNQNKKNISQYVGQFVKGQKSGFGNFKWNKNYEYEGQFQKGQLHGQGTFKFKGRVYAGVWSNGTQVKISQLRRGIPSVILTGNINKDGSIVMKNSSQFSKQSRNLSEQHSNSNSHSNSIHNYNSIINKTHSNVLRTNSQLQVPLSNKKSLSHREAEQKM